MLASVEYDPVHAAVHAYNFPRTEMLCADVSHLDADELRAAASRGWANHEREGRFSGTPDVVFGGPPCQGFSTIGKRLVDDERNQLVFHFFRIVTTLRPRYFVMENVPGMALGGHSSILEELIKEFQAARYRVTRPVRVLNAADFGVPQDRRRLFLFGANEDEQEVSYPRPSVKVMSKRRAASKALEEQRSLADSFDLPSGPTVWDAIADLPDLDRFEELKKTDKVHLDDRALAKIEKAASDYAVRLRKPELDKSDYSYPRKWDVSALTSSMRTEHTALSISRFDETEPGETEPISRFLKLPKFGLCNTLRAGTGSERGAYTSPRPIHPTLPRVISVREAARLHSFPDWFRLHQTKWHGFRQVGNSVPPLLGRAVASSVMRALGQTPTRPRQRIALGSEGLLGLNMSVAAERFGAREEHMPKKRRRMAEDRDVSTGGAA